MTENKKRLLAGKLAFLCNHEARDGSCPMMIDCDCPFLGLGIGCTGIKPEDWIKWMESEKMRFERKDYE